MPAAWNGLAMMMHTHTAWAVADAAPARGGRGSARRDGASRDDELKTQEGWHIHGGCPFRDRAATAADGCRMATSRTQQTCGAAAWKQRCERAAEAFGLRFHLRWARSRGAAHTARVKVLRPSPRWSGRPHDNGQAPEARRSAESLLAEPLGPAGRLGERSAVPGARSA